MLLFSMGFVAGGMLVAVVFGVFYTRLERVKKQHRETVHAYLKRKGRL